MSLLKAVSMKMTFTGAEQVCNSSMAVLQCPIPPSIFSFQETKFF